MESGISPSLRNSELPILQVFDEAGQHTGELLGLLANGVGKIGAFLVDLKLLEGERHRVGPEKERRE